VDEAETGGVRLRSPLFAPGDSARKAERALAGPADAGILDLVDWGAPSSKHGARATVAAMLPGIVRAGVVVRINPRGTPWYLADLAAVVPGLQAGVMLRRCAGAEDLLALEHHLEVLEVAPRLAVGSVGGLPIFTE